MRLRSARRRRLLVVLACLWLAGCAGGFPSGLPTGFINKTQHSDAELWAIWKTAQQELAQEVDLNPLQQSLYDAPAERDCCSGLRSTSCASSCCAVFQIAHNSASECCVWFIKPVGSSPGKPPPQPASQRQARNTSSRRRMALLNPMIEISAGAPDFFTC